MFPDIHYSSARPLFHDELQDQTCRWVHGYYNCHDRFGPLIHQEFLESFAALFLITSKLNWEETAFDFKEH